MKLIMRSLCILLVLGVTPSAGLLGQQRLLVVGGGKRPPDAVKSFVAWSGSERGSILVITWASAEPDASFDALRQELSTAGAGRVVHAPTAPLDDAKRRQFISDLSVATAVFFSGGDQNRIMDVLADAELLRLLREKYRSGVPFGGTSAGAAVLSDPMMTGDADLKILDGKKVGVRAGLGLIPNVMFDQHFLVRQRHNRLFGFILANPAFLGIGIDEDTSVVIEDDRRLTVLGATQVMIAYDRGGNKGMAVFFLRSSDRFDIRKRRKIG